MSPLLRSALFAATALAAQAIAAAPGAEQWLRDAEAAYKRVQSYTAIFHKQQRVAGILQPAETIFLKCRRAPFSLYMKWIRAPHEGSELLYRADWNEGRARAHRGGLLSFFTADLDPRDPALMADNLRPVTSTGIGFLLQTVAANMRKAIERGELAFADRGGETIYGRHTRILEMTFPGEKSGDYVGQRFVVNQDAENRILLRIRVYDRDGQLVENYAYENLVLDAALGEADFDPNNPAYRF
ncbi:MAG TPA: DUF1571 domain-containing protein [Burkholderiales bacterium]|nr:DUF1571 domain-containing protein [Burkholderiales bacterium]